MPRVLLFLVFLLASLLRLGAQVDSTGYGITCAMQDTAAGAYWSAPAAILNGTSRIKTTFDLVFSNDVPQEAQAAIRFAADIWGSYLDSDVTVRVNIDWEDRDDDRLLASAGPSTLFRDFVGSQPNTWYPVALAEAITGRDLNAAEDPDLNVNANSTANWYFGTDGNTPRNRIDLVSVMLHELGHGLGFLASVDTINENQLAIGFGGRFIIYDLFLETETGLPLTDPGLFVNPSEELLMAAANNELVFDGEEANRENENATVPLFAPGTFDVGSSVSHLNEASYRAGSANALMTPFLAAGEAVHDPGPVTLGIFADLGWPLDFILTSTQEAEIGSVAVFPNPSTELVTIRLEPGQQASSARLLATDGRLVREANLAAGNTTLSVAGLPPGMYVLLLATEGRLVQTKVMVK